MDGIAQKVRTAIWLCMTFITGITTSSPTLADSACSSTQFHETASVKYVHDGDTLHLHDGRKVRLIGINTPEVAHGKHAAELYAAEAKNALQDLFKDNKTISLIVGKDKNDRYQRLLAHGFTEDGTNIQAALLAQGVAYAVVFPPNTKFTNCYLEQESIARCNRAGLWKKTKPVNAKKLNDTHIGFKLIKGKLKNININKKGIWLNLDNKLTIGIRPENQPLFDIKALNDMLNQTIMVRGWLNKSNKATPYYLRIRHPQSLQLFSAFSCS